MDTNQSRKSVADLPIEDARRAFAALAGTLFEVAIDSLLQWALTEATEVDPAAKAAPLPGLVPIAAPDEIRRGLRLQMFGTHAHPAHGGDRVEAQRLMHAATLLFECVRSDRSAEQGEGS